MKNWLINRFLPLWAKETVLADNRQLSRENGLLREKLQRQQAYIDGLQAGIKGNRYIYLGGKK